MQTYTPEEVQLANQFAQDLSDFKAAWSRRISDQPHALLGMVALLGTLTPVQLETIGETTAGHPCTGFQHDTDVTFKIAFGYSMKRCGCGCQNNNMMMMK